MQVIAYDNRLLNRNDRERIMMSADRIASAYARYLNAPAGRRGSRMYPIAVSVGKRFRIYFSEDALIIRKARLGEVSEVGEVRLD